MKGIVSVHCEVEGFGLLKIATVFKSTLLRQAQNDNIKKEPQRILDSTIYLGVRLSPSKSMQREVAE